ncbi:hypothetical protein LOAG_12550, partial [Loa loa]
MEQTTPALTCMIFLYAHQFFLKGNCANFLVNIDKQNSSLSLPAQPTCNSPPGDPVVPATETANSSSCLTSSRLAPSTNVVTVHAKKSDSDKKNKTTDSGTTGDSLPSCLSSISQPFSNLSSQSSNDDQDDM